MLLQVIPDVLTLEIDSILLLSDNLQIFDFLHHQLSICDDILQLNLLILRTNLLELLQLRSVYLLQFRYFVGTDSKLYIDLL